MCPQCALPRADPFSSPSGSEGVEAKPEITAEDSRHSEYVPRSHLQWESRAAAEAHRMRGSTRARSSKLDT
jgi:hypothetical protein